MHVQTASIVLRASDYSTVFAGDYLSSIYSSSATNASVVTIAAGGDAGRRCVSAP